MELSSSPAAIFKSSNIIKNLLSLASEEIPLEEKVSRALDLIIEEYFPDENTAGAICIFPGNSSCFCVKSKNRYQTCSECNYSEHTNNQTSEKLHQGCLSGAGEFIIPLNFYGRTIGILCLPEDNKLCSWNETSSNIIMILSMLLGSHILHETQNHSFQEKLLIGKMESLDTIITGIAHDINNPANSIMLNADVIASVWEDTSQIIKGYIKDINKLRLGGLPFHRIDNSFPDLLSGISNSAGKISGLINCLRDWIYSDCGCDIPTEIQLNDCIRNATSLIRCLITNKIERFELKTDSIIPQIFGIKQQIELVIIILIITVYKSAENNIKGLSVRSSINKDDHYSRLEMTFEFANDISVDLFTKLSRQKSFSVNDSIALCYQIIKNHKGNIRSGILPGIGAEIILEFPQIHT